MGNSSSKQAGPSQVKTDLPSPAHTPTPTPTPTPEPESSSQPESPQNAAFMSPDRFCESPAAITPAEPAFPQARRADEESDPFAREFRAAVAKTDKTHYLPYRKPQSGGDVKEVPLHANNTAQPQYAPYRPSELKLDSNSVVDSGHGTYEAFSNPRSFMSQTPDFGNVRRSVEPSHFEVRYPQEHETHGSMSRTPDFSNLRGVDPNRSEVENSRENETHRSISRTPDFSNLRLVSPNDLESERRDEDKTHRSISQTPDFSNVRQDVYSNRPEVKYDQHDDSSCDSDCESEYCVCNCHNVCNSDVDMDDDSDYHSDVSEHSENSDRETIAMKAAPNGLQFLLPDDDVVKSIEDPATFAKWEANAQNYSRDNDPFSDLFGWSDPSEPHPVSTDDPDWMTHLPSSFTGHDEASHRAAAQEALEHHQKGCCAKVTIKYSCGCDDVEWRSCCKGARGYGVREEVRKSICVVCDVIEYGKSSRREPGPILDIAKVQKLAIRFNAKGNRVPGRNAWRLGLRRRRDGRFECDTRIIEREFWRDVRSRRKQRRIAQKLRYGRFDFSPVETESVESEDEVEEMIVDDGGVLFDY
ncbi:MAG: hypothetical protein M1828_003213 [Chrysothrix sp. TS-e1954]|nr:MAG: hypothetical protein M1828_003213 [Chrysothrix sp. TS-e1954]